MLLIEDDGFVFQIHSRLRGISLCSSIIGRSRLGNLAGARIDLTQASIGRALSLRVRFFRCGLHVKNLFIGRLRIVIFFQAELRLAQLCPQNGSVRLGRSVLEHEGFDFGILCCLDLRFLGIDIRLGGRSAQRLDGRIMRIVDVSEVLQGLLQVGIEVLDDFIGLHGFGVMLPDLRQLLLLIGG